MDKHMLRNSVPFLLSRQIKGQIQRAEEILIHKRSTEDERERTFALLKTRAERQFLANFTVSYFQRIAASLLIGQIGLHTLGITKLELHGSKEPWTVVGSFLGRAAVNFLTNIIPEEKIQLYAPVLFAAEVLADVTRFCFEWKVIYPKTGIAADVAPVVLTPVPGGIIEFTVKYLGSEEHDIGKIGTRQQIENSIVGIYGNLVRILLDTAVLLGAKALKWDFGSARDRKLEEIDQELGVILKDDFEYVMHSR